MEREIRALNQRVGRGENGRSEHDIRGRTFPGRSAQAGDALGLGRDIWQMIEVNVDKYDKQEDPCPSESTKRQQVQGLESLLDS